MVAFDMCRAALRHRLYGVVERFSDLRDKFGCGGIAASSAAFAVRLWTACRERRRVRPASIAVSPASLRRMTATMARTRTISCRERRPSRVSSEIPDAWITAASTCSAVGCGGLIFGGSLRAPGVNRKWVPAAVFCWPGRECRRTPTFRPERLCSGGTSRIHCRTCRCRR